MGDLGAQPPVTGNDGHVKGKGPGTRGFGHLVGVGQYVPCSVQERGCTLGLQQSRR